ncbi:hypothetical protein D3C86_1073380 [compost metagenome]
MLQRIAARLGQDVVVARDLGHAADADAVAQTGDGHLVALVHDGRDGRRRLVHDRGGDRIALHRIDRQGHAQRLDHLRRIGAQGQDIGVGGDHALVGLDARDAALVGDQGLDGGVVEEGHALSGGHITERIGEFEAVAGLVLGQAQAPDEQVARGRQTRLGADAAVLIQHLERHAAFAQDLGVLVDAVQLLLRAEQLQGALGAVVVLQAQLGVQRGLHLLAIVGQTHHPRLVQRIAGRGAVPQQGQQPAHGGDIDLRLQNQRGVAHEQPLDRLGRDAGRGPGRGIAGRNLARIGEAGLQRRAALAVDHRDLVAGLGQIVGRRHPDDAGAQDCDLHGLDLTRSSPRRFPRPVFAFVER